MGRYRGRNVVRYIRLSEGPTFVGNTFGLNQASAGLQSCSGDMMGGQEVTAWGIVGKNSAMLQTSIRIWVFSTSGYAASGRQQPHV